ncbi:MAG: hypothetical protein P4L55_05800 [Syntrophobacteraceae bacterium]|nr:hypothetical protein [Syntrophobacteraceae bacterium]
MKTMNVINKAKISLVKTEQAMHAHFQHELNAMHVYCHLSGFIGDRYALAVARKWEKNVIYSHIIYRN